MNFARCMQSFAFLPRITGRKLEQFHVSVSIAAASKVTFELAYEELLKRQLGLFEVLIKVRPQQLVKHFQVSCLREGWARSIPVNLGFGRVSSMAMMKACSPLSD